MSKTESRTALALALLNTADRLCIALDDLSGYQNEYASLMAIKAVSVEHLTPGQRQRLGTLKGDIKKAESDASAEVALLLRLWNAWQEE